jgi:predicted RNA binding protein YcfA (HicA-like mRNA interferase family)
MNGYYNLVIAKLKENGYYFERPAGGSHEMWTNGKHHQTVSRNMPSRDMANKIMKQAGINYKFP